MGRGCWGALVGVSRGSLGAQPEIVTPKPPHSETRGPGAFCSPQQTAQHHPVTSCSHQQCCQGVHHSKCTMHRSKLCPKEHLWVSRGTDSSLVHVERFVRDHNRAILPSHPLVYFLLQMP